MIILSKAKEKKLKWYDNAKWITRLIIGVIFLIIICSQSFASGELSFTLFSSVINHNSIYLLILAYFILIQFSVGKKYFNYFNIFLIFVYIITATTSLLTMIQSFTLITVLSFCLQFVFMIYLAHTMLRDTRFWKEFHLSDSPFNEISNETNYYIVCLLSTVLLIVNLISTVVVSGVVISVLDMAYYLLFGRYIYLYYEYLDKHKLDSENSGNFNEVREKVQKVLDQTEIDDVIVDGLKEVKKKIKKEEPKEEEE